MTTHHLFGVEHEQFVLHDDGTPPTHHEMDALYGLLREQGHSIGSCDAQGRILSVERSTNSGTLIVTNDFFTHVLEVAFPPYSDLERFRDCYLEEFAIIETALRELDLKIHSGGALNPSREIFCRPKATDPASLRLNEVLN